MSYGVQEAEAITNMAVRTTEMLAKITIEGSVFLLKLSGKFLTRAAAFIYAAATGERKNYGRKNLKTLLSEGKKLDLYRFTEEEFNGFKKDAKRYGLMYTAVKRDRADKNGGIYEIMVKAEDADRLKIIFDKMGYASVPAASVNAEETTAEKVENVPDVADLLNKMMSENENTEDIGYDFSFAGGGSAESGKEVHGGAENDFDTDQGIRKESRGKETDTVRVHLNDELVSVQVAGENKEKMINFISAVEQSEYTDIKNDLSVMLHAGRISLFSVPEEKFEALDRAVKSHGIEHVYVLNPAWEDIPATVDIAVKETDAVIMDRVVTEITQTNDIAVEKTTSVMEIKPDMADAEKTEAARNLMPHFFVQQQNPVEAAEGTKNGLSAAQSRHSADISGRTSVREEMEALNRAIDLNRKENRDNTAEFLKNMMTGTQGMDNNSAYSGQNTDGMPVYDAEDAERTNKKMAEHLAVLMNNLNRGTEGGMEYGS